MERVLKAYRAWRQHGNRQFLVLLLRKAQAVLERPPARNTVGGQLLATPESSVQSEADRQTAIPVLLEDQRFENLRPLRTYSTPAGSRRITMVTDSISKGSLFGGVGTAILLSARLANRLDARLRIVTRTERPDPENVQRVLAVYGERLQQEPQLHFASIHDDRAEVDLQPGELFVTTSWWTTQSTLAGVPAQSIIYLLQEDERMFYPYGDDRLRCEEVLGRQDLRFVVNTQLLWNHLVASGLENMRNRALWFEPAFPVSVFHPRPRPAGSGRKRLFFYARPHNLRNLFYLGIKVLDRAISSGVIAFDEWEILLVGSHVPDISFGPGVVVRRLENLTWSEYADLCGSVDLALSLMYTPHPSYPPLDLAASGAIVVTNSFPGKDDLTPYSPNIICASPSVHGLVEALSVAIGRLNSGALGPTDGSRLLRSWETAFAHVVDAIAASER